MNVDEMYRFINFLSQKQRKGFITPSDFNLIINNAQNEFITKRYANIKQIVNNGKQTPNTYYPENRAIADNLRSLHTSTAIQINSEGIGMLPADYWHLLAMYYYSIEKKNNCDEKNDSKKISIDIVESFKLPKRLDSAIAPPTYRYPIATIYSNFFQLFPKNITQIQMNYLRTPKKIHWGYNTVNNQQVYNEGLSVQCELPEDCHNEIVMYALQYVGLNLQDQSILQYGNTKSEMGV